MTLRNSINCTCLCKFILQMCEHIAHCLLGKPMLSPSKPHNHVVCLTAAFAKPAILLSAPKFDTGANTFLLFSRGRGRALFKKHRPESFFSSSSRWCCPFHRFYIFYPKESEAITFKVLQKAYQPSPLCPAPAITKIFLHSALPGPFRGLVATHWIHRAQQVDPLPQPDLDPPSHSEKANFCLLWYLWK